MSIQRLMGLSKILWIMHYNYPSFRLWIEFLKEKYYKQFVQSLSCSTVFLDRFLFLGNHCIIGWSDFEKMSDTFQVGPNVYRTPIPKLHIRIFGLLQFLKMGNNDFFQNIFEASDRGECVLWFFSLIKSKTVCSFWENKKIYSYKFFISNFIFRNCSLL